MGNCGISLSTAIPWLVSYSGRVVSVVWTEQQ